jgi:hypothetical protein
MAEGPGGQIIKDSRGMYSLEALPESFKKTVKLDFRAGVKQFDDLPQL